MDRTIEVVKDLDANDPALQFRSTASLLDHLPAPELSQFRREIKQRHQDGSPRLLCAQCEQPLYVSLTGTGLISERDGRNAFFAHHAGATKDCSWRTSSRHPDQIGGDKFGGASEGFLHHKLKMMLANMLRADPSFSDVEIEHVISRPPNWRKPDVAAKLNGKLIAFDLQLATTLLPHILAREKFYRTHAIPYVWITSSNDPFNLARQAFQDIYWENKGQIFAIDSQVEAISLRLQELHLWALTVSPRLGSDGLRTVWERRTARRTAISWNTETGRPFFKEGDFELALSSLVERRFERQRKRLVNAATKSDQTAHEIAENAWNDIAKTIGAPTWERASEDRPLKAIGVLASAAARKKMDASRYKADQLTAIFNEFLESCRSWTSALMQIASAYGNSDLLSAKTTESKIVRNLGERHPDLARKYRGMLDIIFWKSALTRLAEPPTEIVEFESPKF